MKIFFKTNADYIRNFFILEAMAKGESKKNHGLADFYIYNDNPVLKEKLKEIAKQKGLAYGPYLRSQIIDIVNKNEVKLSDELKKH